MPRLVTLAVSHTRCFVLIVACLLELVSASSTRATTIRFETTLGSFDVGLHDDDVPTTVNNFLNYVQSGRLDGTIVHRNVPDFVIQGGGYLSDRSRVVTDAPIALETGRSNLRGTIAMARTSVRNSATSQWFINVVDNPLLDTSGGGYAVFGNVLGDGMQIVDAIGELQNAKLGGAFNELPLLDITQGAVASNLVVVQRVQVVPEPTAGTLALFGLLFWPAARRLRTATSRR